MLDRRGLANVELRLLTDAAAYAGLDDHPEGEFDLALVDGGLARDRCVETALRRVRPGGHIYLDNSDKESDPARVDPSRALGMRRAEELLLEETRRRGGSAEYFVDFVPAQCFVSQGLLCRL
jgi:predicted O-methyltransferase YrrM